jgi:quercetin dioxygenase-like cupin family protein
VKGGEVPIIRREDIVSEKGLDPGVEERSLVDAAHGRQSLRVRELILAPNSRLPRHAHINTEEAMIILEGTLDATLRGGERTTVGPGETVLAPAGVLHGLVNRQDRPARVMLISPTNEVESTLVSGPRETVGFAETKGLTAHKSAEDRPLDRG